MSFISSRRFILSVAWVLSCLLLLVPLPGHAEDWTYRVRAGDTLWDLSAKFLKPDVQWQRLQEYNRIADPYQMLPGSRLRVPLGWLRIEPAKATVVAVHGEASVRTGAQGDEAKVAAGMLLGIGSHIVTSAEASLTLQFADGSRVLLEGDSELDLDRLSAYGETGMVDTRLRLQHGRVSNSVTPAKGAASQFIVETPTAVSSVRGTHFRVSAGSPAIPSAGMRSSTEVLSGRVAVRSGRRGLLVAAGQGSVAGDGRPLHTARLLDPPVMDGLPSTVDRFPFPLHWPALAGAVAYRLQVGSADFDVLFHDKVRPGTDASLPSLPDGHYVLHLRGIDGSGLEGRDGSWKLTVDTQPEPPFAIAPQAGSAVRDTRPRFRWSDSDEAASYDFQLAATADFDPLLNVQENVSGTTLRAPQALAPGQYYWRVATRDRSGKRGPFSDALPFEIKLEPPSPTLESPQLAGKGMTFRWRAGEPGQRYQLQLARTRDFARPLVDRELDTAELSVPRPSFGTWYLRVRTIDADGYAGPYGAIQKVKVPCVACRVVGTILLLTLVAL